MSEIFHTVTFFLIATLFDLYLFVLAIRIVLASIRADYFNPLTQFAVKLTDQFVKPLRRLIPNLGNIEVSTIILALGVAAFKFFLLIGLDSGMLPNVLGLFVLALAALIQALLNLFFYAVIFQAFLSWFQTPSFWSRILFQITYPLIRPFQRLIPNVGGFDLSPIPALIFLQLLSMILVEPLMRLGTQLAT